jgi:hypothetical protein
MSEVSVTGNLSCAVFNKPRADRSGAVSATLRVEKILNESPLSRIGYECVQFDSGPETVCGVEVAVSRPSADIFEDELIGSLADARSFSRMTAPRISAPADPQAADLLVWDLNLRFTNRSERGQRTCQ